MQKKSEIINIKDQEISQNLDQIESIKLEIEKIKGKLNYEKQI